MTPFIIGSLFGMTVLTPLAVIVADAVKMRIGCVAFAAFVLMTVMSILYWGV